MTHELRLTFDNSVWKEMEKAKEKEEKRRKTKISWIRYIIDKVLENENL